jgi:hypothetical protein
MTRLQHTLACHAVPRGWASTRAFMAGVGQFPDNSVNALLTRRANTIDPVRSDSFQCT